MHKMIVDVICLTKTVNDYYFELCSKTIETLFSSQPGVEFHVVLIESGPSRKDDYISIRKGNVNNKIRYIMVY